MSQPANSKNEAPLESSIPEGGVPLESILRTEELRRRPSRAPDYEKENRALVVLTNALADLPSTIFQTLAETILDITQCDSAGLSLLTRDGKKPDVCGKRFYWPAIAGMWSPHVGGGTPRNFGPCGDVLDQNRTLLFSHFERRYPYLMPVIPSAEECLLVPFYVSGQAVGTIWAIMHSDRRKFDGEDDRVMASLGKFASSAYQAVQGKQEEERMRQENVRLEERTRIARELHDTLLQTCIGTSFQLGAAVESLPADSQVKSKFDRIFQLMQQGVEEGRKAIQCLRSPDFGPLDLVTALSEVRQGSWAQPGVDFRATIVGQQQPLRSTIQQEIYSIGREALVNAFCHSRAKRIDLEIGYSGRSLTIWVRDNGCGIEAQVLDAGRKGHWGLTGMRERAARIGGQLKISTNPNAGTEIELSIPSDVAFQPSSADLRGTAASS
jgi:signal transduction histidine kinase